jgi:hypothetical protein
MFKSNIELTKEDFGEKFDPKRHEQYLGEYEFQEWTFGDREDVIEQASDQIKDKDGSMDIIMKSSRFRVLTILKCTNKAPFKITLKSLRALPPALGEWMYTKCNDLNDDFDLDEIKK